MAPQPKPPGQRRRRNAGQGRWETLPSDGFQGPVPRLPLRYPLKRTREWLEAIWRSPMAGSVIELELGNARRLQRTWPTSTIRRLSA